MGKKLGVPLPTLTTFVTEGNACGMPILAQVENLDKFVTKGNDSHSHLYHQISHMTAAAVTSLYLLLCTLYFVLKEKTRWVAVSFGCERFLCRCL
jgi:hypothetical protein